MIKTGAAHKAWDPEQSHRSRCPSAGPEHARGSLLAGVYRRAAPIYLLMHRVLFIALIYRIGYSRLYPLLAGNRDTCT